MHIQAYDGFARMLAQTGIDPQGGWRVLDVGGADVNGSVRDQLPNARWMGIDIEPAPGVDIVADAADWESWLHPGFDVVIATEVFEHAQRWDAIVKTMALALTEEGPQVLIATCASTGRPPHGARGEGSPPEGQYYGNVEPAQLKAALELWFRDVHVEYQADPGDLYCWARGVR